MSTPAPRRDDHAEQFADLQRTVDRSQYEASLRRDVELHLRARAEQADRDLRGEAEGGEAS